jgi:hypothetical protein
MLTKEELSLCNSKEDYLIRYLLCSLAKSDIELGKKYREALRFFDIHSKGKRTDTEKEKVKEYASLFVDIRTTLYRAVRRLTNHEKADLLEYDNKLDEFLSSIKLGE